MNYRQRIITWCGKQTLEIVYDGRFQIETYGTYLDAIKQADRDIDKYGYKIADILDPDTGEVIVNITEDGLEEEEDEP